MNEATIQKLRELDAKATPGPWQYFSYFGTPHIATVEESTWPAPGGGSFGGPKRTATPDDCEYIALLRNEALPLIESQQKRIEGLEGVLERLYPLFEESTGYLLCLSSQPSVYRKNQTMLCELQRMGLGQEEDRTMGDPTTFALTKEGKQP